LYVCCAGIWLWYASYRRGRIQEGERVPSETVREAAPEREGRILVGTVNVVDPHPLNWLYITWNTME
jgi:hypothetical protein